MIPCRFPRSLNPFNLLQFREGIAVCSGHHCAQPILRRMGVESTVRPSLALYNTREEIDALVAALSRLRSGRGHREL